MKNISSRSVLSTISIRDAVKKIDIEKINSLIVQNKKKIVIGTFTMGDFRRAVFDGLDINSEISSLINSNFKYLDENFSRKQAREMFINNSLILDIPVLNKKFKLIKIISKDNVFSLYELRKKKIDLKNFPVVVMAGGKGTRMDPFTRILPKPLIPLGNDPVLKIIMDYFGKFGSSKFFISINEKGSMIKAYFNDIKSSQKIKYIEEKKPLGTAGSLKLLKKDLKTTFFVTNCDIIIYSHYPSILEFHRNNHYDLTLISSMRNYKIPYGVCDMDNYGKLKSIREKPQYDFFVSTGFYVIEPKVLKLIPYNKKFDMNELINKVKKAGMKVGVFPVSENSWMDVGQWSEYKKNISKLGL
jgi:dTDP-glucose pyrophosphorylase